MWPEFQKVKDENRHELVLSGKIISERLRNDEGQKAFLDVFKLSNINFLEVSGVPELERIPADIGNLAKVTNLLLNRNSISEISGPGFAKLSGKLKLLDLSMNKLEEIPEELGTMEKLATLNLAMNLLTESRLPSFEKCVNLSHVDLSGNRLTSMEFLCHSSLIHLAEVSLAKNKITTIPGSVNVLSALKKFDCSENEVKIIPGELSECSRLKELLLQGNPIVDNRLKKMVSQKGTKPILEYIRTNCPKTSDNGPTPKKGGGGKGGKKKKKSESESSVPLEVDDLRDVLEVLHIGSDTPQIVVHVEKVKDVRAFIVACVIRDLNLNEDGNYRKFIQLQTRLHDGICEKRNLATIATHDLNKVEKGGNLIYTAMGPHELKILPLGSNKEFTGASLVRHLNKEAEDYRKEKKRNTLSGTHQYLRMVNRMESYACLLDSESTRVISFPPITNSDWTKISEETTDVLVEVTSGSKLGDAKSVGDALLKEMLLLGLGKGNGNGNTLKVEQVKVVDSEGALRVVYPSRTDLGFEDKSIIIKRP